MTKRRRKSKINKHRRSSTIVSPIKTAESSLLPEAKLQPNKTVLTSKEIFIAAPAELCFSILAGQLEQPPNWDPIILDTWPVSNRRGQIGATSQVTSNLGGRKRESLAMILRYQPNRAISWVTSKKPKVREDWRLESKAHGTMVAVTLGYEIPGWVIGRFLDKIMHRKKVEQDLDKMLIELKKTVESISREQRRLTGGVKS